MDGRHARPGEEARVALDQAVALRFKHFEEFTEELSANVSTGGMFIRMSRPHPVGAVFEFELRPSEALPLIAGKAQVAWVRRRSEHQDEPVGMGVRFVELEDESRRLIAELVATDGGGEGAAAGPEPQPEAAEAEPESAPAPVATDTLPAAAPAEPEAEPAPPAPQPPRAGSDAAAAPVAVQVRGAFAASRRRGRRTPWILLAAILVLALAASLWPRRASGPAPVAGPPTAPSTAEVAARTAPEPAAEPAGPAAERQQLRAVEEWARSWSEQRVDDYLSAYSPAFIPQGGLDRQAWQRQRRARILAPQWIRVGLAFVEVEQTGPDTSRVRFVQAYDADSYSDVVRKVLVLERRGADWQILRETVEP